jgi:hypothetical protein
MLALLVCEDRECRAAFEVEGHADAIEKVRCQDCGGPLRAVGWADAEEGEPKAGRQPDVRRAA